jgi:hypothetical protein
MTRRSLCVADIARGGTLMANKDKGGSKDSKKAPKKNLKEKRKEKQLKKGK